VRLLIVEDDDIVADAISRGLTAASFSVHRVASAEAAQAAIASGRITKTPDAPRPPASATAAARAGGQAPAMGAIRIGVVRPKRAQKLAARLIALIHRPPCGCAGHLRPERAIGHRWGRCSPTKPRA